LEASEIKLLDQLLQSDLAAGEIVDSKALPTRKVIGATEIALWKGDITQLSIDAIVNAANHHMMGCFQALHNCIDNAIHSRAGVQLRDDCYTIMQKQEALEPTGDAKITRAYNLPSNFVIHTVGPIVDGGLQSRHREELAQAYKSCLDLSLESGKIKRIAFCCISTGVYGYPPKEAAQSAYQAVKDWLATHPDSLEQIVLNVFTDRDEKIYESILG
ncbi:MAG: protein-ADP-ribose hydrolase, partial [Bacteroidota bacterium]